MRRWVTLVQPRKKTRKKTNRRFGHLSLASLRDSSMLGEDFEEELELDLEVAGQYFASGPTARRLINTPVPAALHSSRRYHGGALRAWAHFGRAERSVLR